MTNLRERTKLLTTLLLTCVMFTLTGCSNSQTVELQDLKQRGVRYTLNDKGEVTGLYLYSDDEHPFDDGDLQFVKNYPTVQLLLIESKAVTDAGLRHLQDLKHLEELDLTFCRGEAGEGGKPTGGITDAGIDLLKEMLQLKRIALQQTRVTDAGADRLQRALPKCKIDYNYNDAVIAAMRRTGKDVITTVKQMGAEVEYAETSKTDNPKSDDLKPVDLKLGTTDLLLGYLAREKSLESMTLRGPFTGAGLAHLTKLPKLTSLDIADPFGRRKLDGDAMNTLISLSKLTSLDISGNQLDDAELLKLQKLTALQSLKLVGCLVKDETIKSLKKTLSKCEMTYSNDPLLNALLNNGGDVPAAVESIAHSVERNKEDKLIAVEFRLTRISDKGLAELKALKDLERLQFIYCRRFSDEGMQHIVELPKLKTLTVSHANIGNVGVSKIADLSELQKLDLSTNRVGSRNRQPIDDGGMRALTNLKELANLSLRGTEISDVGLRRLEALEKLESLDVRSTRISRSGLRRFQKKLPNCEVLF